MIRERSVLKPSITTGQQRFMCLYYPVWTIISKKTLAFIQCKFRALEQAIMHPNHFTRIDLFKCWKHMLTITIIFDRHCIQFRLLLCKFQYSDF